MCKGARLLAGIVSLFTISGIVACSTGGGGSSDGAQEQNGVQNDNQAADEFTIADETFAVPLDDIDPFEVQAGRGAQRQAVGLSLFRETPTDRPTRADLTLDADRIALRRPGGGTDTEGMEQITGSGTVGVHIADAASQDPFDEGIDVGAFRLQFDRGQVTVENRAIRLPASALERVRTGSFTIGLEVTADVDVSITIERLDVEFGPAGEVPDENENAAGDENENATGDENENAAGDENDNVSDDENENVSDDGNENAVGDETGDMISAPIEYELAITVILTEDDVDDWLPDMAREVGDIAVSADGSTIAFAAGVCGQTYREADCIHFYVMNADGTGLTDVTAGIPEETFPPNVGHLRLNDTGTRLFAAGALNAGGSAIYYHDLPAGTWSRAVVDDLHLGTIGGDKPYMINGDGTRTFFKHIAPLDPKVSPTPQGFFYADLRGPATVFMDLNDFQDPGVTLLNNLRVLGASADGSVVTFRWNEDYYNPEDTEAMWMVGVGSAPVKIPAQNHTTVFGSFDVPHKVVSADGSLALYAWRQGLDAHNLELVNLDSEERTPIGEETGLNDVFGYTCLSGNGQFAFYPVPIGHLARIDLDTGDIRDTQTLTDLINWEVSDLTYDGRYMYNVTANKIHKVDMDADAGSFGSAPRITEIAFSAASLPNDGETLITVTATVTDAQGLDDVEWIGLTGLVHGVEIWNGPLWARTEFVEDGTAGDLTAGDGTYTCNWLQTFTSSSFFEDYTLPYDVGLRLVAKDLDGNYGFAGTVLTVTD